MGRWSSALPGGVCPPFPQGHGPGRWCPCLGLLLALLCACAQLLCLPFVENGMTSEEGEDDLAFLARALDAFPALQVCDLSGFSGQPRGSQVGYYYPHDYHYHLHFIDDK